MEGAQVMAVLFSNIQPWRIAPWAFICVTAVYILTFFYLYYKMEKFRPRSLEWIERRSKTPFSLERAGSMEKGDVLPLVLITVMYAAVAFFDLGSTKSPQSFLRFENPDESLIIELHEPARVERIFYFTGLGHGDKRQAYRLELSSDGVSWTEQYSEYDDKGETRRTSGLTQNTAELFRWLHAKLLPDKPGDTKFIRVTPMKTTNTYIPLELGEIAIFTDRRLTTADFTYPQGAEALFDEQDIVPARYDIKNSSHFDEIYHGRAAYEHLRGVHPYEKTHPPLGKLITASGIAIFGMTPFGWRFMPVLFGIFMLPLLFILLKWMFGKRSVAVCGTLLFAFEFMHFVQTRISTIDVYAVFFILCMTLFMYRYITTPYDAPFWETNIPFILTGLSFGLGAAAKWQSIYAGFGLLILFFLYLARRAAHDRENERSFAPFLLGTVAVGLCSFIIIPGAVYIACYIPYAATSGDGAVSLETVWRQFWDNQKYMYDYHSDKVLGATHTYSSRWYEWIADWKPIIYYSNTVAEEATRGRIWAFTNPLVTWAGLGALAACGFGLVKRRSHTALFILVGYLTNLIPWIPVKRITFAYHYFPSMLFICIALAYVFHRMIERDAKLGTRRMVVFTAAALALFTLFYPVLAGTQVPDWYPRYLLQWLPNGHWWL
jgi:4-amino-4-deoxy-L-arabinose transferase-like glycosyltransferase